MKIPFHRNAQHFIKSNFILEAMDNRKQVKTLVLSDLSKTFDSIEYGILLRKRLGFGFKGSHGGTLHDNTAQCFISHELQLNPIIVF